jgi:ribosomal protein S18 acetylase RimI-like enzyme
MNPGYHAQCDSASGFNNLSPMITVRPLHDIDTEPVRIIMEACTKELRAVYSPRQKAENCPFESSSPSSCIVAVDHTNKVIGVVEYITRPSSLYVQGLAVAPNNRRRKVASTLVAHLANIAADKKLPIMETITIKETRNVEVFRRLGFSVTHEKISDRFFGQGGRSVTEVTLERHVA